MRATAPRGRQSARAGGRDPAGHALDLAVHAGGVLKRGADGKDRRAAARRLHDCGARGLKEVLPCADGRNALPAQEMVSSEPS